MSDIIVVHLLRLKVDTLLVCSSLKTPLANRSEELPTWAVWPIEVRASPIEVRDWPIEVRGWPIRSGGQESEGLGVRASLGPLNKSEGLRGGLACDLSRTGSWGPGLPELCR